MGRVFEAVIEWFAKKRPEETHAVSRAVLSTDERVVGFLDRVLPVPTYPTAKKPPPEDIRARGACPHCHEPCIAGFWNSLNGLLVRCPWCHRLFGKQWNIRSKLRSGALLISNIGGFFFTMYPRQAIALALLFGLYWWLLSLVEKVVLSGILAFPAMAIGLFLPWLISTLATIRHEIDRSKHYVHSHDAT